VPKLCRFFSLALAILQKKVIGGGTDGQAQPARWAAAKKGEAPEAEDQISRHTGTVTPQAMEAAPEPLSEKQLNQIEAEASWN